MRLAFCRATDGLASPHKEGMGRLTIAPSPRTWLRIIHLYRKQWGEQVATPSPLNHRSTTILPYPWSLPMAPRARLPPIQGEGASNFSAFRRVVGCGGFRNSPHFDDVAGVPHTCPYGPRLAQGFSCTFPTDSIGFRGCWHQTCPLIVTREPVYDKPI
jgi:hypothetical protein